MRRHGTWIQKPDGSVVAGYYDEQGRLHEESAPEPVASYEPPEITDVREINKPEGGD
jgi:hypothetical protein